MRLARKAVYSSSNNRRFHFWYTCQCCIVCATSDACMMCSMTMVALRFSSSKSGGAPGSRSANTLAHRLLRISHNSRSKMSVAITTFTTTCRNRLSSASVGKMHCCSAPYSSSSMSKSQARSTLFCSAMLLPLYFSAIATPSLTSWSLETPENGQNGKNLFQKGSIGTDSTTGVNVPQWSQS